MLLGVAAIQRGDLAAAAAHTTAALRAAEDSGDTETVGKALHNRAGIAVLAGDFRDGAQTLRRALAVKRSAGANDADIGRTLVTLADLAIADYDWVRAADEATEAIAVLARGDHARLRALALSSLALARLGGGAGRLAPAVDAMGEALELLPAVDDDQPTRGLILARHSLIEHAAGRRAGAATALIEGIEAMRDGHVWHEVPPIVEAHAALASRRDPAAAALLLGLAGALREHSASRQPPPVQPAARTDAVCREALGERGYTEAYERGAARYRDGVPVGMAGLITAALAPGQLP
jgi:tetratricopeptide (TPR) repeat protein